VHQAAIRFNLFQVLQASVRADKVGVPAKGLTGQAYEGHYFWDTEIYLLAFLIHTSPRIARNLLAFRYRMLPQARTRATQLGHSRRRVSLAHMYALCRYGQATADRHSCTGSAPSPRSNRRGCGWIWAATKGGSSAAMR